MILYSIVDVEKKKMEMMRDRPNVEAHEDDPWYYISTWREPFWGFCSIFGPLAVYVALIVMALSYEASIQGNNATLAGAGLLIFFCMFLVLHLASILTYPKGPPSLQLGLR